MKTSTSTTALITATLLAIATPVSAAESDVIQETLKLLASDGEGSDLFGSDVAHEGDTIVIGAIGDDDNGPGSGSAYLFDFNTGAELAKLLPDDGASWHGFGESVAISGDTILIGARHYPVPQDTDVTVTAGPGSAYLFDATTGAQLFKLSVPGGVAFSKFGAAVDISGSIAIVGAPGTKKLGVQTGAAYIFNAQTGALLHELFPPNGEVDARFGFSVATNGSTAIVGTYGGTDQPGFAYTFHVGTGLPLCKLTASDGFEGQLFGHSVDMNETTCIVGALADNENGSTSGAAYLFDLPSGKEIAKLLPSDGDSVDMFGYRAVLGETVALVTAPLHDGMGENTGAAYLFDLTTGSELQKLVPSDSEPWEISCVTVSIDGATAVVGTFKDNEIAENAGAAYTFELELSDAPLSAPYCFGDGTGSACPCGNTGALGEGCANSSGTGAELMAVGSSSVTVGEFSLWASGLPLGLGLYFQGDNAVNSGAGLPFGDGLRCVGGNIIRLDVRQSIAGISRVSVSIAAKGGAAPGQTKRYQLWYRDPHGSPCDTTFNLTNGYEHTWTL